MLIKKRPSWAIAEADTTSEHIYLNRREWIRAASFAGLGLTTALTGVGGFASAAAAAIEGYPAPRNMAYRLDRNIMPHICYIGSAGIEITNAFSPKEITNADQKTPKLGYG